MLQQRQNASYLCCCFCQRVQVYPSWNIFNYVIISAAFFGWECFSAPWLGPDSRQQAFVAAMRCLPIDKHKLLLLFFTFLEPVCIQHRPHVSIFLRLLNSRMSYLLIWWPFPTSAAWHCHPVRSTHALIVCDERWSQGSNEGRSYRQWVFFFLFLNPPDGGFLTTRVSSCLKVMCLPLPLNRSAECLSGQFPRGPRGRPRQCVSLMWFFVWAWTPTGQSTKQVGESINCEYHQNTACIIHNTEIKRARSGGSCFVLLARQ